jgi:UDP-N-acetylglucosamine--N-acetylmuramyl-(pentapeptide) pyrophosphoryl-undecaprenol N-acetylglucosamine transferase
VAVTGGGTGGHVFPALAIADEFRRRGYRVIYVGTAHGMEAKLVPARGYPLVTLAVSGIKNQGLGKRILSLARLIKAVLRCFRLLRRERPKAVIGVGGYVSAPLCLAAWLKGTPLFLQEQNTSVGIANRVLGRLAGRVFLGFAEGARYFPTSRTVVTGNPVRPEIEAAEFPYDPSANRLLVLGGSQGARAINEVMIGLLEELHRRYPRLEIVHQSGEPDYAKVRAAYEAKFRGRFEVLPFLSDMVDRYRWASFIVARSGALTVTELMHAGRPALLVPYPRVGQNDQTANAAYLAKAGGAVVCEQGERFSERFSQALFDTFQPDRLEAMHRALSKLRPRGALVSIADHVERALLQ